MTSVFFITGSGGDVGLEVALGALAAGYQVIATTKDPSALDWLSARYGDAVLPLGSNLADPDNVADTVADVPRVPWSRDAWFWAAPTRPSRAVGRAGVRGDGRVQHSRR
jgi:NAD(P)-dependent dehydrogenase (short-subunit alcohol dehydrogenase family)